MTEDTAAPVDTGQAVHEAESWTASIEDADLRGYAENKKFESPEILLSSYRNLEKLRGVPAEELIRLPHDTADREAMMPIYAALGLPESAEQYTRALPDTFDNDIYNSLANQAHMLGLGDGQFQGLQQTFADQAEAIMAQQEEYAAQVFDEWQTGNPDGFQAAARAMAEAGVNEQQVEGILNGDKTALYDFLARIGSQTQESTVVSGDSPTQGFRMSPEAAKAKIADLMADDTFMRQYSAASAKVRDPAVKRMEELHKAAYG